MGCESVRNDQKVLDSAGSTHPPKKNSSLISARFSFFFYGRALYILQNGLWTADSSWWNQPFI
jgi:hypothetical protein